MVGAEVVLAEDIPRHVEQKLDIVQFNGVIGSLRRCAAEFLNAAVERGIDLLAPLLLLSPLDKAVDVLFGGGATQLVLDDTHLLVEEVFALLAVHLMAGLALYVLAHTEVLVFLLQLLEEHLSTQLVADHFEHLLFGLDRDVEMGGDEID